MAATIDFGVWASNTPNYTSSTNLKSDTDGFSAGEDIYSIIFNGILKDVSIVTVSLIYALTNTATDNVADSMTFNNAQTRADMTANIESLLYHRKVKAADSADAWTTPVNFSIADSYSHTGTATSVDGSDSIVLTLPTQIQLSEVKSTTVIVDKIKAIAGTVKLSNVLVPDSNTVYVGDSGAPFKNMYAETFNGNLNGNASTATSAAAATTAGTANKVAYTTIGSSSHITHYLAAVRINSSGDKAGYLLSDVTYQPDTKKLNTNISGSFGIGKVEQILNTMVNANGASVPTFDYMVPAIYYVTYIGTSAYQTLIVYSYGQLANTTYMLLDCRTTNIFCNLRLRFGTIDSSHTAIYMEYSTDDGSTWHACNSDSFLSITRIVCS